MSKRLVRLLCIHSETGVTAIEYGLIASLIGLAIILSLTAIGQNLNGIATYIGGKVEAPAE